MKRLRVLNLGAGIQSTTIALMMAHGEIAPPDVAIFADTQSEPAAVYSHLQWLMSGNVLPFPVEIVSAGSLRQELLDAAAGKRGAWGRPPFFIRNRDTGKADLAFTDLPLFGEQVETVLKRRRREAGMIRRQCTGDYKIDPIRRKVREILGLKPGSRVPRDVQVTYIIGISLDEIERVKPAKERWIECEWPLIDLRMRRSDCVRWLVAHEYPVPMKSACTFCPFRSNDEWRVMKEIAPTDFADACAVDRAIRNGMNGIKAEEIFIHRSLTALDEVNFTPSAVRLGQTDLWPNECTGHCGV